MTAGVRILTVCTYNQTRSVLARALLEQHLAELHVPAVLDSIGFVSDGARPTERTVRLLAARGIDVSGHRSKNVADAEVERAQLIVCAEHQHVVSLAGRHPGTFQRTFTLPEIVRLGNEHGGAGGDVGGWLTRLAEVRAEPLDYLDLDPGEVGEVDDPTAGSPAEWEIAFDRIDRLTRRLAELLA